MDFYAEGTRFFCLAREARSKTEFWPKLKTAINFIEAGAAQGCPLCSRLMPHVNEYKKAKERVGTILPA